LVSGRKAVLQRTQSWKWKWTANANEIQGVCGLSRYPSILPTYVVFRLATS
jgi:hypothetical protein